MGRLDTKTIPLQPFESNDTCDAVLDFVYTKVSFSTLCNLGSLVELEAALVASVARVNECMWT